MLLKVLSAHFFWPHFHGLDQGLTTKPVHQIQFITCFVNEVLLEHWFDLIISIGSPKVLINQGLMEFTLQI